MGDFNCRHEAWNDTTQNQNGQLFHDYIELAEHLTVASPNTPTFSCINGSSIIDLCITSPNHLPSLSNIIADNTIKLFTGAPNRGHFSVTWEWLVSNSAKKQVKWDLNIINWEDWCQTLDETSLTKLRDIEILDDPFQIWLFIKDLLKQSMIDVIDGSYHSSLEALLEWTPQFTLERSSTSQKKLKQRENDSHWAQYMRLKELFKLELNRSLNTWLQHNLKKSEQNIRARLLEEISTIHCGQKQYNCRGSRGSQKPWRKTCLFRRRMEVLKSSSPVNTLQARISVKLIDRKLWSPKLSFSAKTH